MKRILYYILGAATLFAAASCAKNVNWDETAPVAGQDGITLKFSSGALTKTVAGVDNENRVFQIDYFIFPVDSTDANGKPAVKKATEYVYSGHIDATDEMAITYTETITDADGVFAQIFPNGATSAKVFAVANYVGKFGANNDMASPDTKLPADAKSWGDLHALEVGATFFYDDQDPDFGLRWPHVLPTNSDNLFFVMTGEADLEFDPKAGAAADVPLKRLASKVTANFTYDNFREEKKNNKGEVTAVIMWIPQETAGETRVYLSNAIEHTTLGGPLTRPYVADSWGTATKPLGNGTRDIFEYAYNFMNDVPEIGGKKTAHFYTYPINMEEGDDNQPYLKLVLPWYGYKWIGEGTAPDVAPADIATNANWQQYKQKEVYYKIVLPRATIKDPNYIYEFSVNVNIIGSDKEVKIIGEEYVVKDWLSDEPISSNVATGRYISLEIPKDEYDMFVDDIKINFVSSGTVEAQIVEIYQWNYGTEIPSKDYYMQNDAVVATPDMMTTKGVNATQIENWATIPKNTSYLEINHRLNNDITVTPVKRFDASPYVYVVRLHLVEAGDDTAFDRTVTITQYPSMYLTAKTNTDYAEDGGGNNDNLGYVWINAGQGTQNNWQRVRGLDGSNKNPNMYLINTSVLTNSNYIIGDPRQSDYTTWGQTFNQGAWTEGTGTNHRLTYYYPTGTSNAYKTMIAPLFRVASSYGVCEGAINAEGARYRCATYQEDGYPAGRWRVPTKAEIEFITTLSSRGFIPTLFNVNGEYHCASGPLTVNANGTVTETTGNAFVRCIYDEWYWGPDRLSDINVFTWGDKQR